MVIVNIIHYCPRHVIKKNDWKKKNLHKLQTQLSYLCIPPHPQRIKYSNVSIWVKFIWQTMYMSNLPTGPYIFPMLPFGKATDWNFNEWTRLWPLYTILCCWLGRAMGLTVPSINPKQFSRGLPFSWMASTYSCNNGELKTSRFHCGILWLWLLKMLSLTSFVIIHNSGTGLPNRLIMSQ